MDTTFTNEQLDAMTLKQLTKHAAQGKIPPYQLGAAVMRKRFKK